MTASEPCRKCGQDHGVKCKAHNRRGGPCRAWPAHDQDVCRLHGGESPAALEAVRRREVEARARRLLREAWVDGRDVPIADPLTELSRVAGEAVAFKDYLRAQVEGLDGVLTYWQEKDYLDGNGAVEWTKAAEDMRAVVQAYERAQDRCARILASIVKLDLAERMHTLNAEKGRLIADAVREGLGRVDMAAEVRAAAQDAIADALAALDQSPPPALEARQLSA